MIRLKQDTKNINSATKQK